MGLKNTLGKNPLLKISKIFKPFLLALFFLSSVLPGSLCFSESYLTVCAIFQNEAPYLKEWIEYHQLIGVEKFYLYNNSSTDNYKEILTPYLTCGIVELKDWPTPECIPFIQCQKNAYNDCIQLHKNDAYWIAFIDIDEFLVPVQGLSILPILKDYENQGGLFVYWQNYGTSNLPSIPKDALLIESLLMKYSWDYKGNRIGKSIVQPKKIKSFSMHNGKYKDGFNTVSSDGKIVTGAKTKEIPPVIDKIRLNHYWTRAEDYFYGVKIERKRKIKPEIQWHEKKIQQKLQESNQVKDDIMLKFAKPLKTKMGQQKIVSNDN